MSVSKKGLIGLIASGSLALSSVSFAAAAPPNTISTEANHTATRHETTASTIVTAAAQQTIIRDIQGAFAWDQDVQTDNSTLEKQLYRTSNYLCSTPNQDDITGALQATNTNPITHILVSGDIKHAFTASVSEFADKAPAKKVMGCTCGGNPADGLASANASVEGFKLTALIREANPASNANAITFTSRDGYQITLPLTYVTQRYSIIVSAINGEDASSAIGCSNQLWLGSTSARAFIRDVVSIEITHETTPPPAPGAPDQANLPNVGVTVGSAER
ncbi:MAG: molybdopterin-dependent oxidoreductase [Gordonibacter sp.]|nr:molybdopterin-dependent oxidoreductase [Gordonibacter sp.]